MVCDIVAENFGGQSNVRMIESVVEFVASFVYGIVQLTEQRFVVEAWRAIFVGSRTTYANLVEKFG